MKLVTINFVILIERLYLCKHPKVEIRMILMTLIFNLIKVTLNRMNLMHTNFMIYGIRTRLAIG